MGHLRDTMALSLYSKLTTSPFPFDNLMNLITTIYLESSIVSIIPELFASLVKSSQDYS
jgi:hypothetical protein